MRPLQGMTVITLEHAIAAPFATRQLADMGARVIKIEPPGGEQSRGASTDQRGVDSPYFMLLNANKRCVTLNLKEARGRELFLELARDADVVLMLARPRDADEKFQVASDSAELIVAKQRNGPVGELKLTFLRDITRFENFHQ